MLNPNLVLLEARREIYLVLINLPVLQLGLPLLLEGDDDQCHEDVDEEEGEDNEEDNVEYRHLCPVERTGPFVLVCGSH